MRYIFGAILLGLIGTLFAPTVQKGWNWFTKEVEELYKNKDK